MLKRRPSHTSAQSTTSDITFERAGRRERRASAIRALPTLPTGDSQRSLPEQGEDDAHFTNKEDVMYHTPVNLVSNGSKGVVDSTAMYGWSQQPHEQLQKLEEELEGEGPEGEAENPAAMALEREVMKEPLKVRKRKKSPKSSKLLSKSDSRDEDDKVNDFAEEFVRQLTLGGSEEDVLY